MSTFNDRIMHMNHLDHPEKELLFMRLIVALCCLLFGTSAAFAEGDYLLTLNQVSVQPIKADGKTWDLGVGKNKAPDLFVTISVDGTYVLQAKLDENLSTVSPKLATKDFALSDTSSLEIIVFDKDSLSDDLIGKVKGKISPKTMGALTFNEGMIKKIDVTLSLTRVAQEARARKLAEDKMKKESQARQAAEEKVKIEAQAREQAETQAEKESQAKVEAEKKAEQSEAKRLKTEQKFRQEKKAREEAEKDNEQIKNKIKAVLE
jgi:hypothetical protein